MSPSQQYTVTLLLLLVAPLIAQDFNGTFCGTTDNNVLTLRFTFPSSYVGNATFQMIDFGSETFPLCPTEAYSFTPINSISRSMDASSPVPLGVVAFEGMSSKFAATDCMAVQLQWMWITGFTMTGYGTSFSASVIDHFVLTAGAYSMQLDRC